MNEKLRYIEQVFEDAGYEIRIVGGAVRDILLGEKPKDIDLATDATPDEMIEVFRANDIHYIETGLQHGTLTVLVNKEPYEITTLRVDKETDGRWATIEFTRDWKEDARRRDLTVNAMSMTVDGNKVFDYFGGKEDLRNGVVKFVGDPDERIQEDYLRILRYFRFSGRIGAGKFDSEQLAAIQRNANGLKDISGERVWQEMKKILVDKNAATVLAKMRDTEVNEVIGLPVYNLDTVDYLVKYKSSILTLAAMLNINEASNLVEAWKLSNQERDRLYFYVDWKNAFLDEKASKYLVIMEGYNKVWVAQLLRLQFKDELANKIEKWNVPKFPLTGKDLIGLGYEPGPELGRVLSDLKERWFESFDNKELTKNELLEMVNV